MFDGYSYKVNSCLIELLRLQDLKINVALMCKPKVVADFLSERFLGALDLN